ncbi:hypothetical protein I4J47_09645 [Corynebacterium belfantii]|nr:hypothetical protein [Corynebacterium belfantii]
MCPETIYMSLFFQATGELKKEIAACLRQGRAVEKATQPAYCPPAF